MSRSEPSRTPAGRPPWDPINGMRVGGFIGGIVGLLPTIVFGLGYFWLVVAGAVIGAAAGYRSQRRKTFPGPRT